MQPLTDREKTDLKLHRRLAFAAGILAFLLIITGGMARVTQNGGACMDWPTCLGSWNPPAQSGALIDYTHRAATILVAPFLVGATFIAWRRLRRLPWLYALTLFSAGLFVAQIGLGALIALSEFPARWIPVLHLFLSLGLISGITFSLAAGYHLEKHNDAAAGRAFISFRSPFARLSLLVFSLFFLLMVSGMLVSAQQSPASCPSWPLCGVDLSRLDTAGWMHLIHRGIVALSGLAAGLLLLRAWGTQHSQTAVLVSSTAAVVLFFAQALLGSRLTGDIPAYLLGLHQATSIAAWISLSILIASVGLSHRTKEQEQVEALSIRGRKGLAKDLLMLTKPIVVALLLVTTYAGMVIGAQSWPSLSLTFWTLLGGFMAAGGSGAVNQYIDRFDDGKMQRTQKRPIPSGRLTAAEGLAFGVALLLASFYLLTAFVNFTAALLSLAGMIYYVLLYSIFLKKTTVQNIVIGGGAGAIPPLVGWAAATGSLNFPSLLLFAVIFLWTPPHFWALALVRSKDYARAGVPMLPVIRGEKATRWQILIYTIELILLTMLLPILGLGGVVYLVGAGILGLWLLAAAWKVWKVGGNKLAWKMYRFSSMYLAFLFFVLMVDRLI